MSVKCEEPIGEVTVQVWLLYHHPNSKYCTSFVSGMELRTDSRKDRRTDDPITRCPRRTFQAVGGGDRGIKKYRISCYCLSNFCSIYLTSKWKGATSYRTRPWPGLPEVVLFSPYLQQWGGSIGNDGFEVFREVSWNFTADMLLCLYNN